MSQVEAGSRSMVVAGDKAHPEFDEMYDKLYMLLAEMMKKSC